MLPNLRTILAAMALTAILVTLVGMALMPVPGDPYIRSAGFPRVGQPLVQQAQVENPEWQQLHMLGYARRADELNRLLTLSQLPPPMTNDLQSAALDAGDGGSSSYDKGGNSTITLAPAPPTAIADDALADGGVTGSVNGNAAVPSSATPAGGVADARASDPALHVASTPSGASETDAAHDASQDTPLAAPIIVLPPLARPRPAHLQARHHGRAPPRTTAASGGQANAASAPDPSTLGNSTDRTVGVSDRAVVAKPAAPTTTAAASAPRGRTR